MIKQIAKLFVTGMLILATFVTLVVGFIHVDKRNLFKAINNPPSINYIEEDLEYTFLTTYVVVYDYDNNEDYVLCKVKANGFTYNVLYRVVRGQLLSYYWDMISYVQINED